MYKRIIIDAEGDFILQCRAARKAKETGIKPGEYWGYQYEDGTSISVKANKTSIRTYLQKEG